MDKRKKYRYIVAVYLRRGKPSKVRFLQRAKKKARQTLSEQIKEEIREDVNKLMEENKDGKN